MNGHREPDFGEWAESATPAADDAGERRILTVRQVNEEIAGAVARAFPRTIWVRGEVQRLPSDAARRTHVYFELHETGSSGAAEYQMSASLMGWDRQRFGLGRYLDGTDPDFQIANQIEVCLECKVDFYAKFGKMSLKVVGVDKNFALGRLEAARRRTLAHLEASGLLGRNAAVPLARLPLHVGLITSPGSAAAHDFQTGLIASGWAFRVNLTGARMQGDQLQGEVLRALQQQVAAGVDVIVITRGGGSRADLSWFDQQELAVAIAGCPVPVITAIGHEIDRSIADLVAHHSCKTPTAAAEFLVDRVGAVAARVEEAAQRLADRVNEVLLNAGRQVAVEEQLARAAAAGLGRAELRFERVAGRLHRLVGASLANRQLRLADLRARLGTAGGAHLARRDHQLTELARQVARAAADGLALAAQGLQSRRERLAREAVRPLAPWANRLAACETQTRLLDPARLLRRGYTITLGQDGRTVASAQAVAAGDRLTTILADGRVQSIVQPGADAGLPDNRKAHKRGGKKGKTDGGQKTLFR